MSEFLLSCWKGLYPFFIFFCVIGVIVKIRKKQWDSFDSLLLSFFILLEMITAFLPYIFYNNLMVTRRYLLVFVPLYLPFAAAGLSYVWHAVNQKSQKAGKMILILIPVIALLLIYDTYTPAIKLYSSRHKRRERLISNEAAKWIRSDWNVKQYKPIDVFRCDFYQSGKRPLVHSLHQRTGYLSGGQFFFPFMEEHGLVPDYIVTDESGGYPGWLMVHKLQDGYIYKRTDGQ